MFDDFDLEIQCDELTPDFWEEIKENLKNF